MKQTEKPKRYSDAHHRKQNAQECNRKDVLKIKNQISKVIHGRPSYSRIPIILQRTERPTIVKVSSDDVPTGFLVDTNLYLGKQLGSITAQNKCQLAHLVIQPTIVNYIQIKRAMSRAVYLHNGRYSLGRARYNGILL